MGSVHDPSENDASCPFIPICICAYKQLAGGERRSGQVEHSPHLVQGMKHKYEGKLGWGNRHELRWYQWQGWKKGKGHHDEAKPLLLPWVGGWWHGTPWVSTLPSFVSHWMGCVAHLADASPHIPDNTWGLVGRVRHGNDWCGMYGDLLMCTTWKLFMYKHWRAFRSGSGTW